MELVIARPYDCPLFGSVYPSSRRFSANRAASFVIVLNSVRVLDSVAGLGSSVLGFFAEFGSRGSSAGRFDEAEAVAAMVREEAVLAATAKLKRAWPFSGGAGFFGGIASA